MAEKVVEENKRYSFGLFPTPGELANCFRINYAGRLGSSFLIKNQGNIFLVTCRHIVAEAKSGDSILLNIKNEWTKLLIFRVAFCQDGTDIAVIDIGFTQKGNLGLEYITTVHHAQPVMYFGYPLSLVSVSESGINLPLVKTGIVSGFIKQKAPYGSVDVKTIVVESLNNSGFSGGPLMIKIGNPVVGKRYTRVVGVVYGYRYDAPIPILENDASGKLVESPRYFVRPNSGLMLSAPVEGVLRAIEAL